MTARAATTSGSGLPAGGTTGQVLTKNSGTEGDASWVVPDATQAELDAKVSTSVVDTTGGVEGEGLLYDSATAKFKARPVQPGIKSLQGYAPIYTRAQPPYSSSDGSFTQGQTRLRHIPLSAANAIRLVYVNWTTGQGINGLSTITVKAGFEDPYGGVLPVTFNGVRSVPIDPGGVVISDPLVIDDPGPVASPFPYYWSRTLVTVASAGQKWPVLTAGPATTALSGDSYEYANSLSDKTLTSGALTNSGNSAAATYGPALILGEVPNRLPLVFAYGDSIVAGSGDTPTATGLTGFAARALGGAGIPFIQCGTPSEQALNAFAYVGTQAHAFSTGASSGIFWRMQWMYGCSHIIAEHGVNDTNPDLVTVPSFATYQAQQLGYFTKCANRAAKVYATTITPHTTSTDSWATVGNQTLRDATENTRRTAYNDWMRDGAPIDATTKAAVAVGTNTNVLRAAATGHPLTGYFEIADTVESARNSGKWKAAYTSDGIHPNATGAAAAAAGVTTASLTV